MLRPIVRGVTMPNIRGAGCAAVLLCAFATAPSAETLHYYYVSGPVRISNEVDPADRMLVHTGHVAIDLDSLSGGPSLANRTFSYDPISGEGEGPDLYFNFSHAQVEQYYLRFDEHGTVANWSFSNYMVPSSINIGTSISNQRDLTFHVWAGYNPQPYIAYDVLTSKGYREGTPAYEAQLCGAWAGLTCAEVDEYADEWAFVYEAAGGMWFTDPIAFALQIEAVTRQGLANPPLSYHDIQPVPLPAPLALLLGGIAGLALLRRPGRQRASSG